MTYLLRVGWAVARYSLASREPNKTQTKYNRAFSPGYYYKQ